MFLVLIFDRMPKELRMDPHTPAIILFNRNKDFSP
jgi:hypothetical protein